MKDIKIVLADTCVYCHHPFDHIHEENDPVIFNWFISNGMCGKLAMYLKPNNTEAYEDYCYKNPGHDGLCGWDEDNFQRTA